MELNEMEKKQLFQVEGDCQAKVRVLSDRECMGRMAGMACLRLQSRI